MNDRGPMIVAHRGASRLGPENSAKAIQIAERLGADWVEIDVRLTADGIAILAHDHLIQGIPIDSLTYAQLRVSAPESTELCTLEEGLHAAGKMGVNLEAKGPLHPESAGLLAEAIADAVSHREGPIMISSFWPQVLAAIKSVLPQAHTGLLTAHSYDIDGRVGLEGAREGGHHYVLPEDGAVDRDLVGKVHKGGLLLWTWTVDDHDHLRALSDWGVDGIITNDPRLAIRALRGP